MRLESVCIAVAHVDVVHQTALSNGVATGHQLKAHEAESGGCSTRILLSRGFDHSTDQVKRG